MQEDKTVDLSDLSEKVGETKGIVTGIDERTKRIEDFLLNNGLVQDNAKLKESVKRIWIYLPILFILLLGVAFK
ncbi:MAG TPA: hypothetical protein VMW34_15340 [Anaerolineales bacterium]|nr:hypothetical protein [Anaerolineales bacterium]